MMDQFGRFVRMNALDKGGPVLSRRDFLRSTLALAAAASSGCSLIPVHRPAGRPSDPVKLVLSLPHARLHLSLEARGFGLERCFGGYYLVAQADSASQLLIFSFSPQHFSETTIPVQVLAYPQQLEAALNGVELIASTNSRLVFRPPANVRRIRVSLESLLDWNSFLLLMPDLQRLTDQLLKDGKPYFVGLDWQAAADQTAVELPWGIYLQPMGWPGKDFEWVHSLDVAATAGYREIFASSLRNMHDLHLPLDFEILDVRGLTQVSYDPAAPRAIYRDSADYPRHVECGPTTNWDRLEIAGSLSRRFPYGLRTDQLVELVYQSGNPGGGACAPRTNACYVAGRTVQVYSYSLSALGGFLELRGAWNAEPGCSLKGWSQSTTLGRDGMVEFEHQGWLYPFGVPAELIILSERSFAVDSSGHYVAPLGKQAFIRIPQPNLLEMNPESPFRTLSVTTERTLPLDPPSSGNVSDLSQCDYFLPTVSGKPVEFALQGDDGANTTAETRMPMYFVSNKALRKDGLIPEPGHTTGQTKPCIPPISPPPVNACPSVPTGSTSTCESFPPVDDALRTGGLWALDSLWQERSFRFAPYGSISVALAPPSTDGNTTQNIAWIEWVRGQQPTIREGVAARPFEARARTIKVGIPSHRQFSTERKFILGTYRNLQFTCIPVLDPEPTRASLYSLNLLNPDASADSAEIYMQALPLPGAINDLGEAPLPRDAKERLVARNTLQRLRRIREIYFGKAGKDLPLTLFEDLDNESRFGFDSGTDSMGALATPDSPIGLLSRKYGPLGDNTFDPASRTAGGGLTPRYRLDYISYRQANRFSNEGVPFDDTRSIDPACTLELKNTLAQAFGLRAFGNDESLPQLGGVPSVGAMFGTEAEILPGIRMSKVLELTGIDFGGEAQSYVQNLGGSGAGTSKPIQWKYRIKGAEPLEALIGSKPGQISLQTATELFSRLPIATEKSIPLEFGIEASLDWTTHSIGALDLGIIDFLPKRDDQSSRFSVHASASISVGKQQPRFEANASLRNFTISILDSLDIEFSHVSFTLTSAGQKNFDPNIANVKFRNTLAFIENLRSLLKDLSNELGIDINITPAQVTVSQQIAIPPSSGIQEGGTFAIGPAVIANLYFRWGLKIPLLQRDVLVAHFGLASREDPFTISVPPYGGKAHVLIEATTRGIRLFEVSMEYGGMLKVENRIAKGEVSLTAGFFYQFGILADGSSTFAFIPSITFTGTFDIAGIFTASLEIRITLGDLSGTGETLEGESRVTVSIKIGFFEPSYSFTTGHKEHRAKGNQRDVGLHRSSLSLAQGEIFSRSTASCICNTSGQLDNERLFTTIDRATWNQFVKAYAY